MKKTLIALAAVAATGAAFAQSSVTLSGKFGVAYTQNKTTAGNTSVKSNGFGVTDGNVVFAAVEDLGGGLKATASMDVRVRGRDAVEARAAAQGVAATGSVDGRDASVSLSGGFGTVTLGAVESANGIIGLASAGAPTIGQDNGVTLDGGANVDLFQYTTPALIPGLTARVQLVDSIGNPGTDGMEKAATTTDATVVGVAYAAGPLAANADYTKFGQNSAASTNPEKRFRVSASYDLGVAKLGAGYQAKETFAGVKDKQYMLGVSAPVGPVVVGATYAQRDNDVDSVDAKGYELGAQYNLSKRTGVQAALLSQKYTVSGNKMDSFRLRLLHSF